MNVLLGVLAAASGFIGCMSSFFAAIDGPPVAARCVSAGLSVVAFATAGLLASCMG